MSNKIDQDKELWEHRVSFIINCNKEGIKTMERLMNDMLITHNIVYRELKINKIL